MEVKKCMCGCGKILVDPHNAQKFFDATHRRRYHNSQTKFTDNSVASKRAEPKKKRSAVGKKKLSPEERWRNMSWEELTRALLSIHKSYGEGQTMYYNGTLPDTFGLKEE